MKHLPQPLVIERVEEALDIELQHPAPAQIHQPLPQDRQRRVCRATWPKAVRAVSQLRLVHGFQHHRDGALQHLVLEARDPDRSGLATVPFRDVHPPHRRSPIAARLRPLEQRPEVLLQVLRIRLGRLAVDAHGAVLAGASVRLEEQIEVDVMGERRERLVRATSRQLHDPLESR